MEAESTAINMQKYPTFLNDEKEVLIKKTKESLR